MAGTDPTIGTAKTIDEAARICDNYCNGDRDHACLKAIKDFGYYMIGYGPNQLYYEEVEG